MSNFTRIVIIPVKFPHVPQKSIEVLMYIKCPKLYLSGPFGIFCLYAILTISYLRLIPRGPCSSKSRFFLAYWLYISTVSIYAQITRVPPRDFAFWAKSIQGQLFWYKIFVHGKSKLLNVLVDSVLICRAICFSKVRFSLAFYRRKLVFFPWNLAWNSLYTVEAQIY